ncbi:MAG: nucleotidyltransferase [Bacilli bacterium]|nr:nucleotidyltransferase [Bacilli bacterium]
MKAVGIITEYNPFHNGHLYHLKKVKELFPDHVIVLVMSSLFTERGELSVLTKWEKTDIALNYGIDLVVELPFVFATQSADIFARASIEILNHLNVEYVVFGSESDDVLKLKEISQLQLKNDDYNIKVKKYMDEGFNYPTSLSKAINDILGYSIKDSNDLLGISYVRSIIELNSSIIPITIKRENDYYESATKIRKALLEKKNIEDFVPNDVYNYLINKDLNVYYNNLYKLLSYKIICEDDLSIYNIVDEGIDNRIKKYILESNNIEELVNNLKTKRYTYNKINRMLTHILCGLKKEDMKNYKKIEYIRILGFSTKGKDYLNQNKKKIEIPIITKISRNMNKMLEIEFKVTKIYSQITNNPLLIKEEYSNKPKIRH